MSEAWLFIFCSDEGLMLKVSAVPISSWQLVYPYKIPVDKTGGEGEIRGEGESGGGSKGV